MTKNNKSMQDLNKKSNKKVNLKKVHMPTLQQWISKKVIEILGMEDDVVINYIYETLEETPNPDPKLLQLNLTGFLEKNAASFVKELWERILSAQEHPSGIPREDIEKEMELLEKKKSLTKKNSG